MVRGVCVENIASLGKRMPYVVHSLFLVISVLEWCSSAAAATTGPLISTPPSSGNVSVLQPVVNASSMTSYHQIIYAISLNLFLSQFVKGIKRNTDPNRPPF
jgi:hypothetical protein